MSKIKIFSLGGQNENGKNMYVVEVEQDIFVFDAGLKIADDRMLGIDYILPDYSYIKENIKRVKGIFITHGHDEHMGAVTDLVEDIPEVKIYATEFTADIIKNDLDEFNIKYDNLIVIKPHQKIDFGENSIFPISLTHSVPDAVGYVLTTKGGAIFYTGNYVFDSTMSGPYKTDIGKIAYIGKKGILCLMSECLYAEKSGWTAPHHRLSKTIATTLNKTNKRIIYNVFQADLYRIQELFDEVVATDRNIVISGRNLELIIKQAIEKKYISFDKKRIKEIKDANEENIVLLISDDKEKPFSNISRIVRGFDKFVKMRETDTVLFATPIYEGFEKSASKIFDEIARVGADLVIASDCREHNASSEDLMLMLNLTSPKYFMPVIGEFREMVTAKEVAKKVGLTEDRVIIKLNGQVAEFVDGNLVASDEKIKIDDILIDGKKTGDIGEIVIKDREFLGENGTVIVTFTVDKSSKAIIVEPKITSKGFVFEKDEYIKEAEAIAKKAVDEIRKPFFLDFNKVKTEIRLKLAKYLFKITDSKPMILVIIQEI